MRSLPFFCVASLVVAISGCGDDSGAVSSATDAGVDAANDSPADAGPCDPLGTWSVTPLDAGAAGAERVSVAKGDGGALVVAFVDRTPPVSSCGLPDGGSPATSAAKGSFDAATCTLVLGYTASYCFSGEDQCENAKLTLRVTNDTATGTLTSASGWCMDLHEATEDVTATRAP